MAFLLSCLFFWLGFAWWPFWIISVIMFLGVCGNSSSHQSVNLGTSYEELMRIRAEKLRKEVHWSLRWLTY